MRTSSSPRQRLDAGETVAVRLIRDGERDLAVGQEAPLVALAALEIEGRGPALTVVERIEESQGGVAHLARGNRGVVNCGQFGRQSILLCHKDSGLRLAANKLTRPGIELMQYSSLPLAEDGFKHDDIGKRGAGTRRRGWRQPRNGPCRAGVESGNAGRGAVRPARERAAQGGRCPCRWRLTPITTSSWGTTWTR